MFQQLKLEPRLGERYNEKGSELEQNLGIAKMVSDLFKQIKDLNENQLICEFLLRTLNSEALLKEFNLLKIIHFQKLKIMYSIKKQYQLIC